MDLLKQLCEIPAPAGDESALTEFLLNYIDGHKSKWFAIPQTYHGEKFQNCIILIFGNPKTAVFSHIDTVGYTVRYQNQLIPIGSPEAVEDQILVGEDSLGPIECHLKLDENNLLFHDFPRSIERGTNLTYKPNFRETDDYVQSCYLDNRLGVYVSLKLAETLENGAIVFSCWEEHGGGSVPYLIKFLSENYNLTQALIADVTWVTDGVRNGKGVAISLRDRNIPRKNYVDRIIEIARKHKIMHQLEVESSGSSDGRELQTSPYPVDWCFVGAPEDHAHSPDEKVHKNDINAMIALYRALLNEL